MYGDYCKDELLLLVLLLNMCVCCCSRVAFIVAQDWFMIRSTRVVYISLSLIQWYTIWQYNLRICAVQPVYGKNKTNRLHRFVAAAVCWS
jgi:hypothetical protein